MSQEALTLTSGFNKNRKILRFVSFLLSLLSERLLKFKSMPFSICSDKERNAFVSVLDFVLKLSNFLNFFQKNSVAMSLRPYRKKVPNLLRVDFF